MPEALRSLRRENHGVSVGPGLHAKPLGRPPVLVSITGLAAAARLSLTVAPNGAAPALTAGELTFTATERCSPTITYGARSASVVWTTVSPMLGLTNQQPGSIMITIPATARAAANLAFAQEGHGDVVGTAGLFSRFHQRLAAILQVSLASRCQNLRQTRILHHAV